MPGHAGWPADYGLATDRVPASEFIADNQDSVQRALLAAGIDCQPLTLRRRLRRTSTPMQVPEVHLKPAREPTIKFERQDRSRRTPMPRTFLAYVFVISTSMGLPGGALAAPTPVENFQRCQAVFDANQRTIESMAQTHNSAGIRRMFVAHGCSAPTLRVLGASGSALRFRCRYKPPATIICTWGAAAE